MYALRCRSLTPEVPLRDRDTNEGRQALAVLLFDRIAAGKRVPGVERSVALVRPATRTNLRNAFDFSPGAAEPHMKVLGFHSERRRELFDGKAHFARLLERCQD